MLNKKTNSQWTISSKNKKGIEKHRIGSVPLYNDILYMMVLGTHIHLQHRRPFSIPTIIKKGHLIHSHVLKRHHLQSAPFNLLVSSNVSG